MQDIFYDVLENLETTAQAIEQGEGNVKLSDLIALLGVSAETIRSLLQSDGEGPLTVETPNLLPEIKQAQESLKQYALDNDVGSVVLIDLNQSLQHIEAVVRTVLLANAELRRKYARTVGAAEIKQLQGEVERETELALKRERRIAELSGDTEKVQSLSKIIAFHSGRGRPAGD